MYPTDSTSQHDARIRPATRRDLDAVGDLWVELMTYHHRLDPRFGIPEDGRRQYIRHVAQALRDDNCRLLVAAVDGRIVGYLFSYIAQNPPIFPHPYFGFIADLCVTATCRRGGIGALLVRDALAWFKARGLHSVQLNVAHHNPISQAFWRKMGCSDYIDHMWMPLDES
jgi:ribosomal protein S18 acetylase RimI-like enzyme